MHSTRNSRDAEKRRRVGLNAAGSFDGTWNRGFRSLRKWWTSVWVHCARCSRWVNSWNAVRMYCACYSNGSGIPRLSFRWERFAKLAIVFVTLGNWFSLGHSRRAIFPWLVFFEYFPNEKLRESYWYKEYAELQELKVYEEYLELSKSRSKRNSSFIGSRSLSSRTTLPVDFRKLRIRRRNWFPRNLMFKCERKQTVKFIALKCNFASSQHATFVS